MTCIPDILRVDLDQNGSGWFRIQVQHSTTKTYPTIHKKKTGAMTYSELHSLDSPSKNKNIYLSFGKSILHNLLFKGEEYIRKERYIYITMKAVKPSDPSEWLNKLFTSLL